MGKFRKKEVMVGYVLKRSSGVEVKVERGA